MEECAYKPLFKYMKKILLSLFLLFVCVEESNSQNTTNDIKVNVFGLSEEYVSKFKNETNIKVFVDALNKLNVEYGLSSIVITVTYNDGQGFVNATIANYSPLKHFDNCQYERHNNEMRSMGGVGVSVLFQEKILSAITEYKFAVAREGWSVDNDIIKFSNVVTLSKANGDLAVFSGYNYRQSNGAYPFRFYTNVELLINGQYMTVITDNNKALNEVAFFEWGRTNGMDGKQTTAYFMSKFFQPTKEEQIALEAEKKAKAEKEAQILAERKKQQELLKNECLENILAQINSDQKMSVALLNKQNCYIDNNMIICSRGGVSVHIGNLDKEYIGYIGGTHNLLTLLELCDADGKILFSTTENNVTSTYANLISQLFKYKSKTISLFDANNSCFFLDTEFDIKAEFKYSREDASDGFDLKVKVQSKKDGSVYKMSVPDDNYSIFYTKYEDNILLKSVKENITEPGEYRFAYKKQKGVISILSTHNEDEVLISGVYPCYTVILTSNDNLDKTIKYYEKGW